MTPPTHTHTHTHARIEARVSLLLSMLLSLLSVGSVPLPSVVSVLLLLPSLFAAYFF